MPNRVLSSRYGDYEISKESPAWGRAETRVQLAPQEDHERCNKGRGASHELKQGSEALSMLPKIYQAVDKAVKTGVIKSNTAARVKSRLAKQLRTVA